MITRSSGNGAGVKAAPAGEEVELVVAKVVDLGIGQFGPTYAAKLANDKGEEAAFFFSPKLTKPGSDKVSNLSRLEQKSGVTLPDSMEEAALGQLLVGAQIRGDVITKKNAKGYDASSVKVLYKPAKGQAVPLPSWATKAIDKVGRPAAAPARAPQANLEVTDEDIPF